MSEIGWFPDLNTAEDYFEDERLETTAWDDLSTDAKKTTALTMAYNRLYYSREFILPTYNEATDADLVVLQKAQAEMAYYLAQHAADEDRRKGIQAQGVNSAGVVKEGYNTDAYKDSAIPQFVRDLLVGYWEGTCKEFFASEVDRDEDDDDMEL